MRNRMIMTYIAVFTLAAATLTGCSTTSNITNSTESVAASEKNDSTNENTKIVKVESVKDGVVTAKAGELKTSEAGGTPPSGSNNGETPPAKPDGNSENSGNSGDSSSDNNQTPPAKPDGNSENSGNSGDSSSDTNQTPPAMPGNSTFEASDEEITFNITDDTKITVEYLQGTDEGTADDIVKDAVLSVEVDDDGNAKAIVVKNLNKGNGFGGSDTVTNGTSAYTIDSSNKTEKTDKSYTSSGDDENALRVDGEKVSLDGITADKTGGNSSNTENGDFYGQNAGILALNKAELTLKNAVINTNAVNGNGVFSYGEGTVVNISDSTIKTTKNNSGGIQTTGGGTMNAENLDVETSGNSSAAIRSDRGGGTVTVTGGKYVTNGTGSPAIYCTADITAKDASLTANSSEGVVVEGKNSVKLSNCTLKSSMKNIYNGDSDENIHGIMIYQSMSGDAEKGESSFTAEGGTIETTVGDLIYVTNTDCNITLKDVDLKLANETFLRIEGNSSSRGWGTEGANGGDVVLKTENQKISGNITVDKISSLDYTMAAGTEFKGSINSENTGAKIKVTIEDGAKWTLTGDTYVSEISGNRDNINTNGYKLVVEAD